MGGGQRQRITSPEPVEQPTERRRKPRRRWRIGDGHSLEQTKRASQLMVPADTRASISARVAARLRGAKAASARNFYQCSGDHFFRP
jgi:hypothetical protein